MVKSPFGIVELSNAIAGLREETRNMDAGLRQEVRGLDAGLRQEVTGLGVQVTQQIHMTHNPSCRLLWRWCSVQSLRRTNHANRH